MDFLEFHLLAFIFRECMGKFKRFKFISIYRLRKELLYGGRGNKDKKDIVFFPIMIVVFLIKKTVNSI